MGGNVSKPDNNDALFEEFTRDGNRYRCFDSKINVTNDDVTCPGGRLEKSEHKGMGWGTAAAAGTAVVATVATVAVVTNQIVSAHHRAEMSDVRRDNKAQHKIKDEQIAKLKAELTQEIERAEELLSGKTEAEDAYDKTRKLLAAAKVSLKEKDASLRELRQIKDDLEEQLSELQAGQSFNF